jgi:hypothetical protein
MEVRMFANKGNTDELEKEINEWLSRSNIKVTDVKQSYTCDERTRYALVSVWFERLTDVNRI